MKTKKQMLETALDDIVGKLSSYNWLMTKKPESECTEDMDIIQTLVRFSENIFGMRITWQKLSSIDQIAYLLCYDDNMKEVYVIWVPTTKGVQESEESYAIYKKECDNWNEHECNFHSELQMGR